MYMSLRNTFSKLEKQAQQEFTHCLSEGLTKGEIVPEAEAAKLRKPAGPGVKTSHYLPANCVLQKQGTT